MRRYAELGLALVAMVWGSTFVLVKAALDDISTLLFLTLRFSAAAILLALLFRRKASDARSAGWPVAAIGFLLFGGYVVQTAGLRYTSAANSALITGLYIVFTPLFSAVIYRRAPQRAEWLGVLLALSGTFLMTAPAGIVRLNRGDLLTLACAAFYAFHILVLGRYSSSISYEGLALGQVASGAMLGWLTFWWVEPVYVRWTPVVCIAIAVTAVLATALAFTVQSWAQKFTTPTRTALLFSIEPVWALLVSTMVANEHLGVRAWGGAALIMAGILIVELQPAPRTSHPSA